MPLKYQVRITGEASADLADIFEYIWRNSPQNASDVVEELVSSVEALDVLPHRYKVHQFNDDPGYIIRSMPVPRPSSSITESSKVRRSSAFSQFDMEPDGNLAGFRSDQQLDLYPEL